MTTRLNLTSLLLLTASLANGQPLRFEAASVKIADKTIVFGQTFNMKGGPGSTDPGRITYTQVSLGLLLTRAWGVEAYRIDGPAWLKGRPRDLDWYNITATMPPGTTMDQFRQMLQSLLVERFRIQLHHETRTYPGYELVVAPGGAKLKGTADPDAPEPDTGPSGKNSADGFLILPPGHGKGVSMRGSASYAKFQNCTLAELIDPYLRSFISQSTGAETSHIVDKTGLTGMYDYSLKFDSHAVGAVPAGVDSEPSGLPDLFKAMETQLGLKLVKSKGFPLDTIFLDHLEKTPIKN